MAKSIGFLLMWIWVLASMRLYISRDWQLDDLRVRTRHEDVPRILGRSFGVV